MDITLRGNQLNAQLTGQDRYPVFPESETKFFFKVVDAQLVFELNDDNTATALVLHQGRQRTQAKRVQ